MRQDATLKQSTVEERIPERDEGQARDQAAKDFGANPRYVSNAKKIKEEAPEEFEKLKTGGEDDSAGETCSSG